MASVMDVRRRILLNTPHVETASGGVANFKTDMIAPLKRCKVNFLPKQSGSGDPSPTNIRPISGWDGVEVVRCGKNLFDKSNITTGYLYQYTGEIKPNVNYAITQIRINPGDIIVYSGLTGAKGSPCGLWFLDDKKEFISCPNTQLNARPFTVPSGVSYLGFTVCISSNPNYRDIDTAQVEIVPSITSTPTAYEPYTALTFPVTFPATGKNLFDLKWLLTSTGSLTDGVLTDSMYRLMQSFGTAAGGMPNTDYESQIAVSVTAKTGQEYSTSGRGFTIKAVYDDETEGTLVYFSNTVTDFTTVTGVSTAGKKVVKLYLDYGSGGSNVWHIKDLMIVKGSTVQAYEPYTTTLYGGYVDLVSGELVQEWERQFVDKNSQIGIFPWGGIMTDSVSGQEYASVLFRRGSLGRPINNTWQYCYCDKLPLASGRVINTAYMYDGDTYGACISLPTSLIGTTIEEVEAYMENNTFDFVYKLKSPIRYQLTPQQIKTLKGINNVYSDADSAEVKFWTH